MIIVYFFISIILINLIIFFHELGHFLVGILFKEKIKKFSIGIGKEIFGFTKNNIHYSFSLIPIGGFVKFSNKFYISNKKFNFLENKKRIFIIFAGPLFNIIFAFFLSFICINFFGIQNYDLNNSIIGNIQTNSLAEKNN